MTRMQGNPKPGFGGRPPLHLVHGAAYARPRPAVNDWPLPPPADGYVQIRINRNGFMALLLSLLLHALLLYLLIPHLLPDKPLTAPVQSLVINLVPPQPKIQPSPPITEPEAPPPPAAPKVTRKPTPVAPTSRLPKVPKALPAPQKAPPDNFTLPPQPPAPEAAPQPKAAPPVDMMAYVNAARARREAIENYAAHENAAAAAREHVPTEEEIRTANIQRNLQRGTNGIFQILSKDEHSAQFSFKGWTNDFSNAKRELVTVEPGPNEDINHAIVRRMIAVIRRDYNGDFNWESIRLNRVVVLSARPEDNAGLEDFLLKEFFGGSPGIPAY